MNIRFHLSYDIKSTLKSYFLRENIQIFVIMYATLLWTSLDNISKYDRF